MQRAGVTGFKLLAALQTSELFIGADTAATELKARIAAAKAAPITTLDMMSSCYGAPYGSTSVGIAHVCLFGSSSAR
jgi:hypothetical protein